MRATTSGKCTMRLASAVNLAVIDAGTPVGMNRPNQPTGSNDWKPSSAKVGTFGKVLLRCAPVTASAFRYSRCGRAVAMSTKADDSCPPRRSCNKGAAPLYGTWVRSRPACRFSSEPWMCEDVPMPYEP